ncbi:WSC domain-containing protein [Phanerochaete sordida]|uniref:WSC domain-containing protein n=1 Tax=Phanerochaete sordida TaxID=48140 RepID=A0A9P3G6J4_9APHY|nr:WSC domain-containing protein [Phanerochaete sordida]
MLLQAVVGLGLLSLLPPQGVAACGTGRSHVLCCMNVAPWSTNSYVWGNICGYTPSDPSEIVGARCIPAPAGGCPSGSIGTCCAGLVPGPSGQCALGTNCDNPNATPPPPPPPALPAGWTLASACSQDDGSRMLLADAITVLPDNTPAACIAHCAGAGYSYAGVEYGSECHCGAGFVHGALDGIPAARCATPCAGDAAQTCGGAWAIQLYEGPAPAAGLPEGWAVADACASDTPGRVLVGDRMWDLDDNTPATCCQLCQDNGYTWAGVEHANECHCGTGYNAVYSAPTTLCMSSCSGDPGLTCGWEWYIQVYNYVG